MNIVEAPGALEKENVVGRGPGPFDGQNPHMLCGMLDRHLAAHLCRRSSLHW